MNWICILVLQANFSDGGFAKLAPLPHTIFFIFILFFTDRVVGLVGLLTIFSLVSNGCSW